MSTETRYSTFDQERLYRKDADILWALTDTGIVLQNLEKGLFYELDAGQEKIWSFLDGTITLPEVVDRLGSVYPSMERNALQQLVNETISYFIENKLIR